MLVFDEKKCTFKRSHLTLVIAITNVPNYRGISIEIKAKDECTSEREKWGIESKYLNLLKTIQCATKPERHIDS